MKCDGGSCDEVHANHVRVKKSATIHLCLAGSIEMCLDELTVAITFTGTEVIIVKMARVVKTEICFSGPKGLTLQSGSPLTPTLSPSGERLEGGHGGLR